MSKFNWLLENKEPIRSQVCSLTKLLTLTTTQKFPPQRRRQFCTWINGRNMQELDNILYSDEASFYLNGSINKQNNRRYAPLKKHDPVQGGRPANFVHEKPTYDPHIMVFCGLKRDGVFGLKIYHQGTMTGDRYHSLLQYTVLPDIRTWNGGNLDNLYWSQDGAPAHTTRRNLAYLHQNFGTELYLVELSMGSTGLQGPLTLIHVIFSYGDFSRIECTVQSLKTFCNWSRTSEGRLPPSLRQWLPK